MSTSAHAHPNIALVKYWGKAPGRLNVPATPSLSVTLDALTTTTEVDAAGSDEFLLNGQPRQDPKLAAWLAQLRERYRVPPIRVQSCNDFPTGAGLASSASGYAALVTAIDAAFDLGLGHATRSDLARRGSASAARSVYGGFVTLYGPEWRAVPLADVDHWPLQVVVAVTDAASKAVPSTEGMRQSASSPYFRAWVESTPDDFSHACVAVERRDFTALADVAEHSCLKMHGLMLATRPGLVYWNAATVACLQRLRALRGDGTAVFFTIDAGPQVKAVCLPEARPVVEQTLADVPGVHRLIVSGLGAGARIGRP